MRLGVSTLFLLTIVGCSSEAVRDTSLAPQGDVPLLTATDSTVASDPPAIDSRSDSPRATDLASGAPVKPPVLAVMTETKLLCPFPASECPSSSSCSPVTGYLMDEARRCVSPVVVGCSGPLITNTDASCFKRGDGVILPGSSSLRQALGLGPEWTGCDVTEASFDGVPLCPAPSR
jgi:hypothetical protein